MLTDVAATVGDPALACADVLADVPAGIPEEPKMAFDKGRELILLGVALAEPGMPEAAPAGTVVVDWRPDVVIVTRTRTGVPGVGTAGLPDTDVVGASTTVLEVEEEDDGVLIVMFVIVNFGDELPLSPKRTRI
jgi:hypothetical protein